MTGYEPHQYEAKQIDWDRFRIGAGSGAPINLTVAFDILYPEASRSAKYQFAIALLAEIQGMQPIRSRQAAAVAIGMALSVCCVGRMDIAAYRRKP